MCQVGPGRPFHVPDVGVGVDLLLLGRTVRHAGRARLRAVRRCGAARGLLAAAHLLRGVAGYRLAPPGGQQVHAQAQKGTHTLQHIDSTLGQEVHTHRATSTRTAE